jgi:hypothetical protein
VKLPKFGGDVGRLAGFIERGVPGGLAATLASLEAADAALELQLGGFIIKAGARPAVNSDGGGWANFALPTAFPTMIDAVVAQNSWLGVSAANFAVVQVNPAGHAQNFRAFVAGAGLNVSCQYIALGH